MEAARGCDQEPLPVMHGRRCIGWVLSDPWWVPNPRVRFWPGKKRPDFLAGFTSYDNLNSEIGSYGKRWSSVFHKTWTSASVANTWFDLWPLGGYPASGAYAGAAFTSVRHDDTEAGSIYHGGAQSTDTKHLISIAAAAATATVCLVLYDRVLTYEACAFNANANQGFTTTLTAQRYNGNSDGGLKMVASAQTAMSATASNITQLRYTDDAGNATQSMPQSPVPAIVVNVNAPSATVATRVVAPATTATAFTWGAFLPLAVGDYGVQLIADWTTSAANTGTLCFVLCRPLAVLPIVNAASTHMIDLVQQTMGMTRVLDGACLSLLGYSTTTGVGTVKGGFDVAWG